MIQHDENPIDLIENAINMMKFVQDGSEKYLFVNSAYYILSKIMCFLSFTVGLAPTRGWSPISLQFCHRSRRGPPHGGLLLPTCTAYGSSPSGSGTNELSTRPPRVHVQQLWGFLSPRIHQVLTTIPYYRLQNFLSTTLL